MKRFFSLILCLALAINIAGCSSKPEKTDDKDLYVIGFSQVGSESDWRLANTKSMVDTFTRLKDILQEYDPDLSFSGLSEEKMNGIVNKLSHFCYISALL